MKEKKGGAKGTGRRAAKRILEPIRRGATIAVAAWSRGIANLSDVTRIVVRELKAAGAKPFIVPAMGSHGGATAEGQKTLLEHLGITEEYTAAAIRSSMEVVQVAASPHVGMPVVIDAHALKADGIVIINRVKAHAAYAGTYESGLVKMVTIGLGMVDFTTRRAFEKFDPEQTYPNTLTSTLWNGVKIPMILKNDRQALQACIRTCNPMDYRNARMMRIRNTLCMGELEVSENLLDAVRAHPGMRVLSDPYELAFDRNGNLL